MPQTENKQGTSHAPTHPAEPSTGLEQSPCSLWRRMSKQGGKEVVSLSLEEGRQIFLDNRSRPPAQGLLGLTPVSMSLWLSDAYLPLPYTHWAENTTSFL